MGKNNFFKVPENVFSKSNSYLSMDIVSIYSYIQFNKNHANTVIISMPYLSHILHNHSSRNSVAKLKNDIDQIVNSWIDNHEATLVLKTKDLYVLGDLSDALFNPSQNFAMIYENEYMTILEQSDKSLNINRLLQILCYIRFNTAAFDKGYFIKDACIKTKKLMASDLYIDAHILTKYLNELRRLKLIEQRPVKMPYYINKKQEWYCGTIFVLRHIENYQEVLDIAIDRLKTKYTV